MDSVGSSSDSTPGPRTPRSPCPPDRPLGIFAPNVCIDPPEREASEDTPPLPTGPGTLRGSRERGHRITEPGTRNWEIGGNNWVTAGLAGSTVSTLFKEVCHETADRGSFYRHCVLYPRVRPDTDDIQRSIEAARRFLEETRENAPLIEETNDEEKATLTAAN